MGSITGKHNKVRSEKTNKREYTANINVIGSNISQCTNKQSDVDTSFHSRTRRKTMYIVNGILTKIYFINQF
jgi:hypothetical protein